MGKTGVRNSCTKLGNGIGRCKQIAGIHRQQCHWEFTSSIATTYLAYSLEFVRIF